MDLVEVSGVRFRSALIKALVMPVVLVVALAGGLLWQIHNLLSISNAVDYSDKVLAQAYSCNKQLTEMNTGLRGYLITPHPAFLEPYKKTAPNIRNSFGELADMVKGNQVQLRRIDALRSDYEKWEAWSRDILALRNQGGNYADYSTNLQGELLMDSMRTLLTLFINLQQELREHQSISASAAARRTTAGVLGLAGLLAALLALFARRQLTSLSSSYTQAIEATRKHAEALRENEEQFRQMALNASDLLYIRYPDDERLSWFGNVDLLLGYEEGGFPRTQAAWVDSLHPDDRDRVTNAYQRSCSLGQAFEQEYQIRQKDGTYLYWSDRGRPVCDGQGRLTKFIGACTDITDRQRLEKQLRQSQKMEAVGTLAGGIAHDFNNILGAINGYWELAVADFPSDHAAQSHLDQIGKAVNRAKALVRQILSFSREQEHAHRPVQLEPVVDEAIDLLRAALPATIEIRQYVESPLAAVLGDPTQLHQVIMNLGTNALHAMGEKGGVLEIRLNVVSIDAQAAARSELKEGPHVRLALSDTGQGMERAVVERIFEPFYTTKEQGKGTGLGLYVVHSIVKGLGGTISAYSEPGSGTTFNVYLPAQFSEEAAPAEHHSIISGGNKHILFVDDEQPLVEIGQEVLERQGYKVTTSNNGLDALERFYARPSDFDLVITDSTMPGMSGCELAASLTQLRPDLPIILVTGFTSSITKKKANELGIRKVLLKPATGRELGEAVSRALFGEEMPDGNNTRS
jgi:PAS domain S-box-containing protein